MWNPSAISSQPRISQPTTIPTKSHLPISYLGYLQGNNADDEDVENVLLDESSDSESDQDEDGSDDKDSNDSSPIISTATPNPCLVVIGS